jgi:hypothetical protein
MKKEYNFNKFMKNCKCKNDNNNNNISEETNFPCSSKNILQGSSRANDSSTKTERYSRYLNFPCYKKVMNNPQSYLESRGLAYTPVTTRNEPLNIIVIPIKNFTNDLKFYDSLKSNNFITPIQRIQIQ